MEIILLENISNLGKIGEKVIVKNGYGRNFLLKTGKALRFSKENLEIVNKKKDELIKKILLQKKNLKKFQQALIRKLLLFIKRAKRMVIFMDLLNQNKYRL